MQATADSNARRRPIHTTHLARHHGPMLRDPGHKALRKGRWSEPGRAYLVTFTTHARQPLFHDPALALTACRAIVRSIHPADAAFACWVLMPDHFHAILRLAGHATLSRCVQRIKGRSSMACRKTTCDDAVIWARAFHDHAVRADEDLVTLAHYVIANPVRARIVDDVLRYPWWDAEWL